MLAATHFCCARCAAQLFFVPVLSLFPPSDFSLVAMPKSLHRTKRHWLDASGASVPVGPATKRYHHRNSPAYIFIAFGIGVGPTPCERQPMKYTIEYQYEISKLRYIVSNVFCPPSPSIPVFFEQISYLPVCHTFTHTERTVQDLGYFTSNWW